MRGRATDDAITSPWQSDPKGQPLLKAWSRRVEPAHLCMRAGKRRAQDTAAHGRSGPCLLHQRRPSSPSPCSLSSSPQLAQAARARVAPWPTGSASVSAQHAASTSAPPCSGAGQPDRTTHRKAIGRARLHCYRGYGEEEFSSSRLEVARHVRSEERRQLRQNRYPARSVPVWAVISADASSTYCARIWKPRLCVRSMPRERVPIVPASGLRMRICWPSRYCRVS
jgi:hypothetical protein